MLENLLYTCIIFTVTVLCGLPLLPNRRLKAPTVLVLSYSLGFILLSLAGLMASVIGFDIFLAQCIIVLLSIAFLGFKSMGGGVFGFSDDVRMHKTAFSFLFFYILLFLALYSQIPTWMAGDVVERAGTIRLYLDGLKVPVSVFPFGTYWEYYPKAFQVYSYYWMRVLPVELTEILKIIPLLATVLVSLGVYALVNEMGDRETAKYSLFLSGLCFIPNYANLIWGGFTSLYGLLLMVAALLAAVTDRRNLLVIFVGLLLSHPRSLFYSLIILFGWVLFEKIKCSRFYGKIPWILLVAAILVSLSYAGSYNPKNPGYFPRLLLEKDTLIKFIGMWYLSLLAIFSLRDSFKRRNRLDSLVLSWIIFFLGISFASDIGVLPTHRLAVDRTLLNLYIPLSVLGAYSLNRMRGHVKKTRGLDVGYGLLFGLFILGTVSASALFYSYYGSWGLPEADYGALRWLGGQNYVNSVSISLDATGEWVYPFSGVMTYEFHNMSYLVPDLVGGLAANPTSENTLTSLDELKDGRDHVLIYLSSVSTERPGYRPPFLRFFGYYLDIDTSGFSPQYYKILYSRDGVFIFEYLGRGEI